MAGSDTVTVACTLPNGLVLDLYGARTEGLAMPTPMQSITVNGGRANRDANGQVVSDPRIIGNQMDGGVGLTPDVPVDFWNAWYEAHKDSDLVRNRVIYAVPKLADAEKEARATADDDHGFAPVDPDAPPPGIVKSDDV